MPFTSTAINACDVDLFLENASGTQVAIGGSSNSVDINFDNEIGEYMTFGHQWPGRLECGKDASFTINVVYSSAADEGFDIIKNWYHTAGKPGDRTLQIYVPDKNVGSDYWLAQVKIANYSFTADRGEAGPIMVSAELLPNGAVTHSVTGT